MSDTELDFDSIEALEEATAFKFENPGDMVAGFITNIGTRSSAYGTFKFLTIETRSGLKDVPVWTGGLKKRVDELPLEIGDGIKIVYNGTATTQQNGKAVTYKSWPVGHKAMHRPQPVRVEPQTVEVVNVPSPDDLPPF